MKGCTGGGAQSFRRKGAGGARLAGSGCNRARGTESRGSAQDCADIARVLHTRENHKKNGARGRRRLKQLIEGGRAWVDKCGDALRMFGVGKALEKAIGRVQGWKRYIRPADERRETFMVPFAGLAEEDRFNAAAGTKRFL